MARGFVSAVVLAMMLVSTMPLSVSAEDSGGVQASTSTVAISPSNPVEGGSVTIRLTLYNSNNFEAEDVFYGFYWNDYPNNLISANTVDIPAGGTVDVEVVKSGLTYEEDGHKVWIDFEYNNGGKKFFYSDIFVSGLPDLETSTITTSPSSVKSGDALLVSTLIENTGSEDADASRMQIDLDSQSEIVNVPAIPAGETEWVSHTMIAPSSGTHDISVTLDLDDAVVEADEDNTFLSSVTVDTRMDISHFGDLSITVGDGDLQGPWTISGTIVRTDGIGTTEVPMRIEIKDDNSVDIPLPTFYVNITGGESAQQAWSYELLYSQISTLSAGNHQVTAAIDPYGTGNFIQESTSMTE